MIGKEIAHYRVQKKLGQGGMGEVYLAQDTKLDRKVALKFLPLALHEDEVARKRFHREAKSAAALDQPFICKIYETGQTEEGHDFISMEYVEGRTLKDELADGPLSTQEVIRIAAQVSEALQVAHQKGIVHRDLKPANIMLTTQGHVKVMDFGLAKRLVSEETEGQDLSSGLTQQGSTLGTPAYMSPEQVKVQPADQRSDIFSMGIILYELLSGSHPFRRPGLMETIGAILHEQPSPLTDLASECPKRLEEMISRMLAKDPQERYQSIDEVVEELGGLVTAGGVALDSLPTGRPGHSLLIAMVAILAVGSLGWWVLRDSAAVDGPVAIHSIAVLPLSNLSGDPEQEYFADGMTEALITDLSKIGALKVISRTSAMRYKKAALTLPEIAQELNVDAVVEGSVLREGNRVGITAQLIEAATEKNLWADRYERELTSILSLQGELAQTIAGAIQVTLTPNEEALLNRERPVNPEAYEAYLKGRFHWYKVTLEDLRIALQYFKLAIEKDPNYALAYVGYADALATPAQIGQMPATEVFPKAKELILKALELDDSLPEAHDLLARIHFTWDWDWEAAEREFRRAFELNPNYPDAHVVYSQFLALTGRWDDVVSEVEFAIAKDPYNMFYQLQYGGSLAVSGRYDEAIAQFQKMLETNPNLRNAHLRLWALYSKMGLHLEALNAAKSYFGSEVAKTLTEGYEEGGYARAMEVAGDKLSALSETRYISPSTIARVYAEAGMKEQALAWLERSYHEHESRLVYVKTSLFFAGLRDDSRFQNLLRRMNLDP